VSRVLTAVCRRSFSGVISPSPTTPIPNSAAAPYHHAPPPLGESNPRAGRAAHAGSHFIVQQLLLRKICCKDVRGMMWADIIQASFRYKRVSESSETLNEDPIRVFYKV
jgi:hypothetical protein